MATAGRKILLVDDEEALLELMAVYLAHLGYEVQSCGSAQEALASFGCHPSGYALLIADVTMPGIGGPELAVWLRDLSPELPVLLTSGYSQGQIPLPASQAPTRLLQKPFSPEQLSEAVRNLIGS